ncbi:MAG: hypothetical protein AAF195_04270 [Pseudomonadota bacterium]
MKACQLLYGFAGSINMSFNAMMARMVYDYYLPFGGSYIQQFENSKNTLGDQRKFCNGIRKRLGRNKDILPDKTIIDLADKLRSITQDSKSNNLDTKEFNYLAKLLHDNPAINIVFLNTEQFDHAIPIELLTLKSKYPKLYNMFENKRCSVLTLEPNHKDPKNSLLEYLNMSEGTNIFPKTVDKLFYFGDGYDIKCSSSSSITADALKEYADKHNIQFYDERRRQNLLNTDLVNNNPKTTDNLNVVQAVKKSVLKINHNIRPPHTPTVTNIPSGPAPIAVA